MSYVLLAQSDYSPADAFSFFLVVVLIVIAVAALVVIGSVVWVFRHPYRRRRCPSCGSWISDSATRCLSCGSKVQPTRPVTQQPSIWDCACGAGNPVTHSTCWRCGGPSPPRIVVDAAADPDSDTG